jgi:Leucine-rich repeat (LRR) protein
MATAITSITGLQNFTNLTHFRADYNALDNTTVDLSGLDKLEEIDIGYNVSVDRLDPELGFNLTAKFIVNLTGCSELIDLDLSNNDFSENQLDSIIGFSELTNLEKLKLAACKLTGSIDLTIFPYLDDVDVGSNFDMTNVIISNTQPIYLFNAGGANLSEEVVDTILVTLSTNGVTGGGVCQLSGLNTAPPSAIGLAAKEVLESNFWTVSVNTAPEP